MAILACFGIFRDFPVSRPIFGRGCGGFMVFGWPGWHHWAPNNTFITVKRSKSTSTPSIRTPQNHDFHVCGSLPTQNGLFWSKINFFQNSLKSHKTTQKHLKNP